MITMSCYLAVVQCDGSGLRLARASLVDTGSTSLRDRALAMTITTDLNCEHLVVYRHQVSSVLRGAKHCVSEIGLCRIPWLSVIVAIAASSTAVKFLFYNCLYLFIVGHCTNRRTEQGGAQRSTSLSLSRRMLSSLAFRAAARASTAVDQASVTITKSVCGALQANAAASRQHSAAVPQEASGPVEGLHADLPC